MRLTKRYIVENLNNIKLSMPIRYERYYINDNVRIQKKDNDLEKEILDDNNIVIEISSIDNKEFDLLKTKANSSIIKDSYLYINDNRITIKKYHDMYNGFIRAEVKFSSKEEMDSYEKEIWMGKDITNTPLSFDKDLTKLTRKEFLKELKKYK